MKAILVIDMPNDMKIEDTKALNITLFNGLFVREVKMDCPLQSLPKPRILPKWQTENTNYGEEPWFSDGWNACLEEIVND